MNGIPRTGIPDGAGELSKPSKVRGLTRVGNQGGSVGDGPNTIDTTPMSDAARKGAFGKPITPRAATSNEAGTDFKPEASDAGAVEKYGLARGKYGANSGQS